MSAAASADSRWHAPRAQTSRAATRLLRTGQTSRVRETTAPRFRGLRLHTRRTIAATATVRTTVLSRATARMARTTGRATADITDPLLAIADPARVTTARLRATAVRSRTTAEVVIAVQVRATAGQLLATVAVRTGAQLRPMAGVDVRWVPTVAEAERRPTAEGEAGVDVRAASVAAVADPPEVVEVTLPRLAAADAAVEAAEAATDTGKSQVLKRAQDTPFRFRAAFSLLHTNPVVHHGDTETRRRLIYRRVYDLV